MPGTLSPWPVIAIGVNGHPVKTLQYLLRARGHNVAVDGDFGPQTDGAVKAFQTSKGLTANGSVNPQTWTALIVQVKKGSHGDAVRGARRRFRIADRCDGAGISTRPLTRHPNDGRRRHRRPDDLAGSGQRNAVRIGARGVAQINFERPLGVNLETSSAARLCHAP